MNISLYSFKKRINSTAIPIGDGYTLDVKLKDGTSIYAPVFILNDFDTSYNYLKWDDRYYFISDIEFTRQGIYTITCNIDMLRTYHGIILNSTAFVLYSRSRYNANVTDRRLRADPNAIYRSTAALLLTDGVGKQTLFSSGTYIVNYVTQRGTWGPTGLLWLTKSQCTTLASKLTDDTFLNLENFEKQFTNAYQALINVKYVPFSWAGGGSIPIYLGTYDTGVVGSDIIQTKHYSTSIAIPWNFSDFRNNSDFTSFLLYLPGYGFTTINREDVRGLSSLLIQLDIDGVTGQGTYIVGDIFRGACNFACNVSVGTISGNRSGMVGSALQVGTSFAMSNPLGMLTGAASGVMAALQRNVGNVGSQGGVSAAFATPGTDWRSVYMIGISHNTTVDPDNIRSTQGRPLNRSVRLGDLSGYVQTLNRSISTGIDYVSNELNRLLDGGVYLE